ncbi:restriction endonuclease subunit S [Legionella pneumophila]
MNFESKLSDIAEIVMGQSPKGEDVNSDGIGYPLLNGPTEFGTRYPVPKQYTTNANRFSQKGDVLFCVRGSTTGRMNFSDQSYAIGRGLAAIRGKNGIPTYYIFALIANHLDTLLSYATGSTFPNISKDHLNNLNLTILEKECAQKASHILSTLDNKIELNKKINQTLESIAQTIFKSWFVDFDPVHAKANASSEDEYDTIAKELGISREILDLFPSEFEESELGFIPEGWQIVKLEDLADVVGGGTPSTSEKKYYCKAGSGISWLSPKDLSGYPWNYISMGSTDITDLGLKKSSARMLPKGTVLFSSRAPIGYMAIAEKEVCTNQGFKSLIPKNGVNTEFLYFLVKNNIALIEASATGSTFKEISGTGMKQLSVICPSKILVLSFKKAVAELFMYQKVLRHETNSLIKIRDTLLPELLSGKIDVSSLNLEPEHD